MKMTWLDELEQLEKAATPEWITGSAEQGRMYASLRGQIAQFQGDEKECNVRLAIAARNALLRLIAIARRWQQCHDEKGTPLGISDGLWKFAEERCGHNLAYSHHALTSIIAHIDRLERISKAAEGLAEVLGRLAHPLPSKLGMCYAEDRLHEADIRDVDKALEAYRKAKGEPDLSAIKRGIDKTQKDDRIAETRGRVQGSLCAVGEIPPRIDSRTETGPAGSRGKGCGD